MYFNMHSKDVIHAFWIPAFRLQEDAVPGITTHYRATPDRLGTYPVVCNLLCGVGHSLMRTTVHVVTPAQFQAWLKSQLSAGAERHRRGATRRARGRSPPGRLRGNVSEPDDRSTGDTLMAARLRAPGFYRAALADGRRRRLRGCC